MTKRRRPAAIEALEKHGSVRRLTDENLETLHDYALIALLQCQYELQRRGVPAKFLVQRTDGIAAFSTDPGKPPLCRCAALTEVETFMDRDGIMRPASSDTKPEEAA